MGESIEGVRVGFHEWGHICTRVAWAVNINVKIGAIREPCIQGIQPIGLQH